MPRKRRRRSLRRAKVAVATCTDRRARRRSKFASDKDKNYYAKSSVVEGIYKVTADLGDGAR